jgi:hypothetical protein
VGVDVGRARREGAGVLHLAIGGLVNREHRRPGRRCKRALMLAKPEMTLGRPQSGLRSASSVGMSSETVGWMGIERSMTV